MTGIVIGPHLLLARVDNHHLSDKIAAWIIRLALQRGQPSPPESAGPVDIAGNLCVGAQFAVSASRGGRMAVGIGRDFLVRARRCRLATTRPGRSARPGRRWIQGRLAVLWAV